MTPYEIMIVINAHCSPTQPYDRRNAPIYAETMANMVTLGLFEEHESGFVPTEKLHVYCKAICLMPMPTQTWTIPAVPNFLWPIKVG